MLEHGAETVGMSICLLIYAQHIPFASSAEGEKN